MPNQRKPSLTKLFVISLIICSVITAIIYDLIGGLGLAFYLLAFLSFIPSILILLVKSRLENVAELPEKVVEISDSIGILNEKLKEEGLSEEFDQLLENEDLSLSQKLKLLVKAGPSLWKIKSAIQDSAQLDIIITALSIANPMFIWFIGASFLITVFWGSVAFIMSFVWLIFS